MTMSQGHSVTASYEAIAATITIEAATAHLLGSESQLTAIQLEYLDLIGNGNGRYDVGDLAAAVLKGLIR